MVLGGHIAFFLGRDSRAEPSDRDTAMSLELPPGGAGAW